MKTGTLMMAVLGIVALNLCLTSFVKAEGEETVLEERQDTATVSIQGTRKVTDKDKNGLSWDTDVTKTGPLGTSTAHADGDVTRTGAGTAQFDVNRTGSNAKGGTWNSTTSGDITKTDNGATWNATTQGSTDNGHSWTSDKNGTVTKNDDGTKTISKDITTTTDSGKTISTNLTTTVTKTDDGKSWVTDGTRTGPKGTSTISGSGTASKDDNGTVTWSGQRQVEGHAGQAVGASSQGQGRAGGGSATWNSSTQKYLGDIGEIEKRKLTAGQFSGKEFLKTDESKSSPETGSSVGRQADLKSRKGADSDKPGNAAKIKAKAKGRPSASTARKSKRASGNSSKSGSRATGGKRSK